MIVGEFEVSADNDGWRSRQTKLADRQLQYERLQDQGESNGGCSPYLASDCWADAPQSGRRLSEGSSPAPSPPAPSPPVADSSDDGSSRDEECWNTGERWNDLHVVYRAKSDGGDLLSPAIFEQVCELEGQILALNGYAGTCRAGEGDGCTTVNGGQCLAPASAVSELRSAHARLYGGPPRDARQCARVGVAFPQRRQSASRQAGDVSRRFSSKVRDRARHPNLSGGTDCAELGAGRSCTPMRPRSRCSCWRLGA